MIDTGAPQPGASSADAASRPAYDPVHLTSVDPAAIDLPPTVSIDLTPLLAGAGLLDAGNP